MRPFLSISLLVLALFGQPDGKALAGPLEDAGAAYKSGDYKTALRLVRPLAIEGNVDAQNSLGVMYARGQGVPRDVEEAAYWFREAARRGSRDALYTLEKLYADGELDPDRPSDVRI